MSRMATPALRETKPSHAVGHPGWDVLRLPLLGRFLKWPYSRRVLQACSLLVALVMIYHAFWGPQLAPKNLGVLLTWVHFRGMVVIVILLAGNLFCAGCPFLLPRDFLRKWIQPRWEWPSWLRNKWPAVVTFVGVLFVYECLDLWSNPFLTGVVIVAYFAMATLIDVMFRRASFCKYVCPVGQFNFVSSTMSPLELKVREPQACSSCATKDCIRGTVAKPSGSSQAKIGESSVASNSLPILQRGCELGLFQPRKIDNLDCTLCLDCVYACPHDNIGLLPRMPGEDLSHSGSQSGLGRLDRRFDVTALIAVFTFGAILNAFAMISPVYALERWIAEQTGLTVEWPILAGMFVVGLVLEPVLLLGLASGLTRLLTRTTEPLLAVINRFSRSLIPIGFGIWLAHYGFHFFTGFLTVIPVSQNAVREATGQAWLGEPLWRLGGLPENVVYPMELGFMGLGLLGSALVAWRIARQAYPQRTAQAFAPWLVLHGLLFGAAVWIMTQPMDMRGTFLGG